MHMVDHLRMKDVSISTLRQEVAMEVNGIPNVESGSSVSFMADSNGVSDG